MLLAIILLMIGVRLTGEEERAYICVKAILAWNIWSFAAVEILSQLHMLNKAGIIAAWGMLNGALLILVAVGLFHRRKNVKAFRIDFRIWKQCMKESSWILAAVVLAGIIVLIFSILTVPYNWDSMTYHLPRIAQWAKNRSVAHYAANDVRQLASPVLAEFINVQVYILSGQKDYLLNLLQSCSYLVNAYLVYEIAVKIGCCRKLASLSTLLFMTMPIAFGEALNTQVDLFSTLWLLMFILCYIDVYEEKEIQFTKDTVWKCAAMGLCLSFGYLAKPSVNVGMAVLLCFLLIRCIRRRDRWQVLLKIILCVIPAVFIPLIPEWTRNYQTFAALTDPVVGARQLVGTLRPDYILINMIKNFAYNWSNIYLYGSNEWMVKIVFLTARILGVDMNDGSITEDGVEYIMRRAPSYGHDTATNPVVVILAFFCFIWGVAHMRKSRNTGSKYSVWAMVMLLVFCAVVRWEPYVNRYMLAYLAALCPMIGWQIQEITGKCRFEGLRTAIVPVVCFLCLTELISLTRYHQEIWHEEAAGRPNGYFANNYDIKGNFFEVLDVITEKDYKNIGIKIGGIEYEYPLWAALSERNVRIENVLIENVSDKYSDIEFVPECILTNRYGEEIITLNDREYKRAEMSTENGKLAIYVSE